MGVGPGVADSPDAARGRLLPGGRSRPRDGYRFCSLISFKATGEMP